MSLHVIKGDNKNNESDTRKSMVVEYVNLRIKQMYTQLKKNLIFKKEKWQVEVESIGRKVKRLKSRNIFSVFTFRMRK